MKKNLIFLLMLMYTIAHAQSTDQTDSLKESVQLLAKVEANPNDLSAHEAYIEQTGFTKWNAPDNPALLKQYEIWMQKYPESAVIPYEIGHAYASKESPKARPYLLKAVQIDPKFDKAYFDLWIDAERWGDFAGGQAYLAKAVAAAPSNPDYAFYYAGTFDNNDPEKYHQLSLDVAKRFPASERGAQALYWLAARSSDTKQKIGYYELLKDKFPPDKFSWSSGGMSGYFELLLKQSAAKALTLAQYMKNTMTAKEDKAAWDKQLSLAQNIINIQSLLSQHKPAEALAILEKTKVSRWSEAKVGLLFLKAKALDAEGKTGQAYDEIKSSFAGSPEKEVSDALNIYGAKLGKDKKQIEKDVWYVRDTASRQATPFSLKQYLTPGNLSLSDLQGKVVLLTYWFPGCGPCRGEFPHFQNVVNKFKGQDLVYVGINIASEQNEYVIPFMKSSGYSFIPLEDVKDRKKGNLDNRDAAPMNFLIDRQGRIMFRDFRIDGNNEDVLETMISSLLNRK